MAMEARVEAAPYILEMAPYSRAVSWFGWYYNFSLPVGNTTIEFDSFDDFKNATQELHSQLQPASDVDIDGVKAAIYFNIFVFMVLALMYECLRLSFPGVYAARQKTVILTPLMREEDEFEDNPASTTAKKEDRLPDIYENKMPFHWVWPILGVSWRRIREVAGLDAYFYLRYIRMCYRITSVTALWGMLVLFPTFWSGQNEAEGWYKYSMANVVQGSSWRIWVPSVFMYMFSGFCFYVMKNELMHFMELRLDFLGKAADRGVNPQHHYSIMIENIPKELRCDRALHDYFNKLFPGKVHSANVLLNLPDLEAISTRKQRTVKRLERSIATYEAMGVRPTHIMGRPRINCCDIELSPLECLRFERAKFHDIATDGEVSRGALVDSIDYYTHDLEESNKRLFLRQKDILGLADGGNRSLRVHEWFNTVSKIADMFIDENDDYDYSYEESEGIRSKSGTWDQEIELQDSNGDVPISHTWSSDGISLQPSAEKPGKNGRSFDQDESRAGQPPLMSNSRSAGGTEWKKPEKTVRTSSGRRSVNYDEQKYNTGGMHQQKMDRGVDGMQSKYTSGDIGQDFLKGPMNPDVEDRESNTKSKYGKSKEEWLQPKNDNANDYNEMQGPHREFSSPLSAGLSLDPSPSDLQPSIRKYESPKNTNKRVQFSLRTAKSDGDIEMMDKKEPLIEASATYDADTTISGKKRDSKRKGTIGRRRRVVSRLGGRVGLDFAMYGIKQFNRKVVKTLDDNKEETKIMSSTGFVTFFDLASTTFAAGVPLNHSPGSLNVKVAPEARDLQWPYAHLSKVHNKRVTAWTNLMLILGAVFWSIPVAIIQMLATAESVAVLPGMDWILDYGDGSLVTLIDAYLPVLMLLGLILFLPIVLEAVAVSYEHRKTKSDIDECVVHRYFYYQLANIYITVTAGSLWKSLGDVLEHPHYVFEILGNSLPTVVGYFIALLVTKIFGGLPSIMLRVTALTRYLLLRTLHRKKFLTQRDLDQVYRQEPVWYGWEYPNQLMVIVICFTYACISPVVLIFGSVFFLMSLVVYKKQVLYVYTPAYESGGALFPQVIDHTIVGLICGQITFISYCSIRGGFFQPIAMCPLLYMSFWIKSYFNDKYAKPAKKLTLERAFELDDKIGTFKSSTKGVTPDIPSRRGKNPPQIGFSSDYYRQPVLTEPPGEPLPYRSGRDDVMTKQARVQLAQNRIHMWSADRRMR